MSNRDPYSDYVLSFASSFRGRCLVEQGWPKGALALATFAIHLLTHAEIRPEIDHHEGFFSLHLCGSNAVRSNECTIPTIMGAVFSTTCLQPTT